MNFIQFGGLFQSKCFYVPVRNNDKRLITFHFLGIKCVSLF